MVCKRRQLTAALDAKHTLKMSRRRVVQVVGAGGAGVALLGLGGCFPPEDEGSGDGGPDFWDGSRGDGGGGPVDAGGGSTDGGGGPTDGGGTTTDGGGGTDAGSGICGSTDVCIDLQDPGNSVLVPIGGWGILNAGFDRLILVRTGSNNFTVDSSVCTHQGCDVEYRSSGPDLYCPCHGADFAMDGSVISGPTRIPLQAYRWDWDGRWLAIHH